MKQQLSLLFLLLGCHLMAADEGIIDRCSTVCSRYLACLENQAAGKPEFKICMKPRPPCTCVAVPEKPPEIKVAGDAVVHMCDTACDRYSKCRIQTPKGPCVMPAGCRCAQLPDKVVVMPLLPDPCKSCMNYWMCRRGSLGNPAPPPCIQLKTKECQCSMHDCFQRGLCEEDMPDELALQQKMPCLKPNCNPDEETHDPLRTFCNLLCAKHRKCLAENNPRKPCERPAACNCQLPQVASMAVKEIPKENHCPIEVCGMYWNCIVEKMGRPPEKQQLACVKPRFCECECLDHDTEDCIEKKFMRSMKKPMLVASQLQPMGLEQCQPEICADYWMCTWIALRDEKVACLRPQGCVCNCAAAGICAQADIPAIARVAFGAQYVWPPPVVPIHDMTCSYSCAKFSLCKKLFEPERCQLTGSCECGMLPIREVEPKHP